MPINNRPTSTELAAVVADVASKSSAAVSALAPFDQSPPPVDTSDLCAKLNDQLGAAQSLVSAIQSVMNAIPCNVI